MHILRCIFLIFICLGFMRSPWAKELPYPGQELVGIWRVVKNDLSEFPQPVSQVVMDGLVDQLYFQPPGQLIEVAFDGIYETSGSVRGGTDKNPHPRVPQLIFHTIPPLSQDLCKFGIWRDAICKNGIMQPTEEIRSFLSAFCHPKKRKAIKTKTCQMARCFCLRIFFMGGASALSHPFTKGKSIALHVYRWPRASRIQNSRNRLFSLGKITTN